MANFTRLQQTWFSIMYHAKLEPNAILKDNSNKTNEIEITIPYGAGEYATISCTSDSIDDIEVLVETYLGKEMQTTNKHVLGNRARGADIDDLISAAKKNDLLSTTLNNILSDAYSMLGERNSQMHHVASKLQSLPTLDLYTTNVKHGIERLSKALAAANLTNQLPAEVRFDIGFNGDTLDTITWVDADPNNHPDTSYSIRRNGVEFHIMSSDGRVDVSLNVIKSSSDLTNIYAIASELFELFIQ